MKKLLIVLILLSLNVFSQDIQGIATYKKSITKSNNEAIDSITNPMVQNMMNKVLDEAIDEVKDIKYELVFTQKASSFSALPSLSINDGMGYKLALTIEGGDGKIYTDFKENKQYWEKEAYGGLFIIERSLDSLKWKIIEEEKMINGMTCLKAVGYRNQEIKGNTKKIVFEAWFNPELSIPSGPAIYGGLPGLIVELSVYLSTSIVTYQLSKITYSEKKVLVEKPYKGINITEDEFDEKGKNMRKQFIKSYGNN